MSEPILREGRAGDLRAAFELAESTWDASRRTRGLLAPDQGRDPETLRGDWERARAFVEFVAVQPEGSFWICEQDGRMLGYTLVARFGAMDELTELWVDPEHAGEGIGHALLSRIWPGSPSPDRGRLALSLGTPAGLSLYTDFGVMPVAGHWHMRHRVDRYLEARAQERDAGGPAVHVLTADRALEEWKRLEPGAIGHERPLLHEFFSRTRSCLALLDERDGRTRALCWVSAMGEIGPAVGQEAPDLVPVVLAALDRVAKAQEPESFGVFCTSDSWWLLARLRGLGFRVHWPAWVLSSVPLPGLDRYLPTQPARLL